jgi:hypothetical protein
VCSILGLSIRRSKSGSAAPSPATGDVVSFLEGGEEMSEIFTSSDLLKLGYQDDELLLEDPSLCTVCSSTCTVTSVRPE